MFVINTSSFLLEKLFIPFSCEENNNFLYDFSLNEIHVWYASLDDPYQDSKTFYERDGLKQISASLIRKRYKNSGEILRRLLSKYLDCSPEIILFEKGASGKPFVSNVPEISFNITYSGAMILLAFSQRPVGIDIELIRPVRRYAIAKKFFSPHECDILQQANSKEFFFQLWTAKEAALKADGRGITRGLRGAFSTIKKNIVTAVHLDKQQWAINSWSFTTSHPTKEDKNKKDFIAALATPFSPSLIRWCDFSQLLSRVSN